MVYLPFIVTVAQRYKKDAGIGTIIALMLPYALILLGVWIVLFIVWYLLGLPLGPGYPVGDLTLVRLPDRSDHVSHIDITFAILVVVVVLFVSNRLPVDVVAIGAALALWATGVLTLDQALAGFGDPTVLFIASLFVVSEGLDATGVTAWAGQRLIAGAGDRRDRLLVLMIALVAGLTALISVNGAVAALLPVVVVIAVRLGRPPSQAADPARVSAPTPARMLALTGTPVNVLVVGGRPRCHGRRPSASSSSRSWVCPWSLGTIAIVVLFGDRLLPERSPLSLPADLSTHARTLVEQYDLNGAAFQLRMRPGSTLVGADPQQIDVAAYPGVSIVGTQSGSDGGRVQGTMSVGDILLVRGDAAATSALAADRGLAFHKDGAPDGIAEALVGRTSGVAEVILPPRSTLVGHDCLPGYGHAQWRPGDPRRAAARSRTCRARCHDARRG